MTYNTINFHFYGLLLITLINTNEIISAPIANNEQIVLNTIITTDEHHPKSFSGRYKRLTESKSTEVKPFFSKEHGIYVVPAVASEVNKLIKEQQYDNQKQSINQQTSLNTSKERQLKSIVIKDEKNEQNNKINESQSKATLHKEPTKRKKLFVPNLFG